MSKIDKVIQGIGEMVQAGELDNDNIISIIENAGAFLNLQTLSDYARANGLSYNGVKKCRQVVQLFGVGFVVDNE